MRAHWTPARHSVQTKCKRPEDCSLDNTLVQYMNEFSSTLTPGGGLAARESYDACTNTVAATNTSLKPTLTLGWGVAAGLGRRPGCVVQVTFLLSLQYPSGDELGVS